MLEKLDKFLCPLYLYIAGEIVHLNPPDAGLRCRQVDQEMRRFFYGLGIVTAVILVAVAIGLFVLIRNGATLDRESKSYAERCCRQHRVIGSKDDS